MCGIVGFIGQPIKGKLITDALKKLEYRGYDSWGAAFFHNNKIESFKTVGSIGKIPKKIQEIESHLAIGHTRWATHGGISKKNAHPHVSFSNEIAIVHNGIIENFSELKKKFPKHNFNSETDSEIVLCLIENEINSGKDLLTAVSKAVSVLEGSFALLVFSSKEPDRLIAVKNESPLLLGISDKGFFAASDQIPLSSFTKKFVFLEDGDIALVSKNSFKCFDFSLNSVERKPVEVESDFTSSGKLKYSHFMLKEIMEQPVVLRNALKQDKKKFDETASLIKKHSLCFVGNGTSFNAGLFGKEFFSRIAGIPVQAIEASEFPYQLDFLPKNSVVFALSQSGETADVLDSVKKAKKKGFKIISMVNVFNSSLARLSDKVIYLNCGEEIGVASTKAFTSQVSLLYLLANSCTGKFDSALNELNEVSFKMQQAIEFNSISVKELSSKIKSASDVYFIGRSLNYPVALEAALKLKEISYIHAEAFQAGSLKHGPLALISKGVPVIAVMPKDKVFKDTLNNAVEAKARGAFIVGVSNEFNEAFDFFIKLPETKELLFSLVSIIPLQLLAFHTAVFLERNPDRPRNLAKSVTVK
ncbi:MAG: glutamine--fructose-6-phosphate transaminase (isomerizing) [archaeon]